MIKKKIKNLITQCRWKVNVHKQEDGKIYLDFISAFGGINGSIGAKSTFEIPIDKDCKEIAIYRSNNQYQTVLEKDVDSGEWIRIPIKENLIIQANEDG